MLDLSLFLGLSCYWAIALELFRWAKRLSRPNSQQRICSTHGFYLNGERFCILSMF